MRPLIFVALVGLAFAAIDDSSDYDRIYSEIYPHQIEDTTFRSGREYRYFYDGQVMTGIPGTSKQHSATRIQALVTLQVQNGKSLFKLSHVRMGKLNRKVPNPRVELPFGVFETSELLPHLKVQLEKPIQFKWESGEIDELILDSKDEPWSTNIKRGVLNMLHLKLKNTHGRPDMELNEIETGFSKHYRTMEKTVEGECETIYTVESLPSRRYHTGRPVLNVTKSINFEQCQNRPELKYNWRFHQNCPNCDQKFKEDEKSLKSSTVIKYNITGDRENYLIESVKVESQYLLVPFNEEANVIASYVNQTLVLYKSGPIKSAIEEIRSPVESQSDLVYSLRWEEWKEKFYLEGDKTFHSRNPYSELTNKIEVITDMVYKLVKYMERDIKTLAPKFFDRLVTVLRMCNKQELDQVHEHFFKGSSSKLSSTELKKRSKDIIVNAVALCGTKECLFHIIHKIESGDLTPVRAASAMRQFHQARVVSPKMITELKRLTESTRVRESYLLKQSVYLTFGSLVYSACADNKDQMAMDISQYYAKTAAGARDTSSPMCTESQKRELVNWMWSKFEAATTVEDRILILKMIGNSGLQSNIQKLEKVILQKGEHSYSPKVRIVAVSAVRLLMDTIPKKVQRVLVPVMMNKYEDPEVRIAASYFALQTQPDRFLLNMIAKDLNVEPSFQYRSYLWTYLNDLANSTSPCFKRLATDLKLALRFAHKVEKTFTSSRSRKFSFYSELYKAGLDLEPFVVMSNQSFMPRQLGLNFAQTGFGFFGKWATSFGVSQTGLDQLLYKLMSPSGWLHERSWLPWQQTRDGESSGSSSGRYNSELKGIYDSMGVSKNYYRGDSTSTRDPFAYFYYRLFGQDLFYYPIKSNFLKRFSEEGISALTSSTDLAHLYRVLNEPFDVSYATLVSDFKHKIPTTVGLPITIKVKMPLVANIKGKVELPKTLSEMRSFTMNINVKPSIAVKRIESMEIWCPVVNSGLKVEVEGKLFTPIRAVITPQLANHEKIVKIIFEPPTETREIALLQSRPITYTRTWPKTLKLWQDAEEKTIYGQEYNRIKSIDRSYFESLLGVKLQVRGRMHWTPFERLPNTPFIPYSGPNKIVVEVKPGVAVPEKIELLLKGKFSQSGESFMPSISYSPQWMEESSSTESQELLKPMRKHRSKRSTTHAVKESTVESTESSESSADERKNGKYSWKADRKHEISILMKTIGGGTERKVEAKCDFSYSPALHFMKWSGKVHVSPLPRFSSHPYSTCFKGEIVYPKAPNSASSVYDKQIKGEMKVNWSPSQECTSESTGYIRATLQAERSGMQLEQETDNFQYWQCRKSLRPVACQKYLSQASELKKYILNLDYKDVPMVVRNVTNKLWLALKHKYFWQTDIAQIDVRNPTDKIRAVFRVDPTTDRRLNITVKTPRENVTMYDTPLPFYVRPLNVKRSLTKQYYENTLFGKDAPICEISDSRVKTFDEAEFGLRLGTCWTVLAKDCSEDRSFAVLAKRTGESDEKAVKIITPYGKVKLMKKPGHEQIMLEKDGEVVPMRRDEPIEIVQHGHVIISVKLESNSLCRIFLPEQQVKVYFDGYAVNVKMQTPLYMGRQCGICGNMDFDSNRQTEFNRLDSEQDYNEPEFDVRRAFHQYTIKDDSCTRPEKYEEMCEDENCHYKREAFPDSFRQMRDPHDLPQEWDYRTEITPTRKTRKIERHGKLCFSTRPIPTCPSHTYPVRSASKTEEVTFKCKPKTSSFWGTYESSSSSSSDSTESESTASGQLKSASSSSSQASSDTSSSETTYTTSRPHHRGQRHSSERMASGLKTASGSASSSNSDSTSSSSSSERFFDSGESRFMDTDMETIKMTVTIPERCQKF
jgi:hypothetical protein